MWMNSELKLLEWWKNPKISVKLKYSWEEELEIMWDDNFWNVLWWGQFILINENSFIESDSSPFSDDVLGINKITTANMKIKTSNTYEPKQKIILKKWDEIESILDFSKLPIHNFNKIISWDDVILGLYYLKNNNIKDFKIVSNKLKLK
jgi:hypothetical protein